MTKHLVELRSRLGKTQEEMESASGVSRVTLSQIESGRAKMSWLHFTSLMQIFTQNHECKELLMVRRILDERLLSNLRQDTSEMDDFNIEVPEEQILFLRRLKEAGTDEAESEL